MADTRKRSNVKNDSNRIKSVLTKKKVTLIVTILILVVGMIIGALYILLNTYSSNEKTNPIAVISTSMGTIKVELYKNEMPTTTANFVRLAKDGFYDGLVFHRVIDDFMIQGGGFYPNGTHKNSPYGPIKLEINSKVLHVDGAISMARTNNPDSATSQFFICDGSQPHLDGSYAVFGRVIEGIEVVRAIASLYPEHVTTKYGIYENWPVNDVLIYSVTIDE
ncbi:MAG: peptidylprolyl isomerase [Candidatus Thermoplasmatota archaeon]